MAKFRDLEKLVCIYSEFIIAKKFVCIILFSEDDEKLDEIVQDGTLPLIAVSGLFNAP